MPKYTTRGAMCSSIINPITPKQNQKQAIDTHHKLPSLICFYTRPPRLLPIQRHASIVPRPVMVDLMYDLGNHLWQCWVIACELFLSHGDARVGEEDVEEILEAIEKERQGKEKEDDDDEKNQGSWSGRERGGHCAGVVVGLNRWRARRRKFRRNEN